VAVRAERTGADLRQSLYDPGGGGGGRVEGGVD